MNKILYFLLLILSLNGISQTNFQATPRELKEYKNIGGNGAFSIAFNMSSLLGITMPFNTQKGTTFDQDFRSAIPWAAGVEITYGVLKNLEIGVSAGFEYMETRNNHDPNTPTPKIHIISAKGIPIEVIGRYLFHKQNWRIDLEFGAGIVMGDVEIGSTELAFLNTVENINYGIRAHGALGLAFPWTDKVSTHLSLGYGYQGFEAASITSLNVPGSNGVITTGAYSGIFAKGQLRYTF